MISKLLPLLAFTAVLPTSLAQTQPNCAPSTFTTLSLFNAKILSITTNPLINLTLPIPSDQNHYAKNITSLNACEVLITYTHPGYNDTINTVIWLPTREEWSGRFLGAGGGGWRTGVDDNRTLAWAASEGFAVVSTDSGHGFLEPEDWALLSPGNLNWNLIQDFASVCLDDAATLGKQVVKSYYGREQSYSYWNGCSQGGRQGYMLAQRYPGQYDGILATAPAVYWGQILMEFFWGQAVMNDLGEYPSACEFEVIHLAALNTCATPGLDGIILPSTNCTFNPSSLVGKSQICPSTNGTVTITSAAAQVASAIYTGSHTTSGTFLWHGLDISAPLLLHAQTSCSSNGSCVANPIPLVLQWMKLFLAMDPSFDTSTVNTSAFPSLFHQSVNRFDSILGTSDPDLTGFRDMGGKMITWHGIADQLLGPKYTEHYVKDVYDLDQKASEYFRYFEAPGLEHCGSGTDGYYPGDALERLVEWVEKDVQPETLEARNRENGRRMELCKWPEKVVYLGGDVGDAKSFGCK